MSDDLLRPKRPAIRRQFPAFDESLTVRDRFQAITRDNIESLPQWRRIPADLQEVVKAVSLVLPFRTNRYVVDQLIDWRRIPDDPIYQLTFPQPGMLPDADFSTLRTLVSRKVSAERLRGAIRKIQDALNPHPGGQLTDNAAHLNGHQLPGIQHKYSQSVLFFPAPGQRCHAYCSFCFRWPQFVGRRELRLATQDSDRLAQYLRANPHVNDVILTGGDPMIMRTAVLRRFVEPLLDVETVRSIRIGSKALSYWPHRFVTDNDADDLLLLFEQIVTSGRHLAFMAHISHPAEMSTTVADLAVRRVCSAGAVIRTQSPLLRHINDNPQVWSDMWLECVGLGMVPYYMFVERDTGPRGYFEVPLAEAWDIFREAYQHVSGLGRTVRGPVMSCHSGKCHVLGVLESPEGKAFLLEFLQARQPELVRRPFCARFDATATWFDHLHPLTESDRRFFASASIGRSVEGSSPDGPIELGTITTPVDSLQANGSRSTVDALPPSVQMSSHIAASSLKNKSRRTLHTIYGELDS